MFEKLHKGSDDLNWRFLLQVWLAYGLQLVVESNIIPLTIGGSGIRIHDTHYLPGFLVKSSTTEDELHPMREGALCMRYYHSSLSDKDNRQDRNAIIIVRFK